MPGERDSRPSRGPYRVRSRLSARALIDITPLIDLVFLLIIFFMVTSSLGSESSVTVHLPRARESGEYRSGTVILSIDENNGIYLNDKSIRLDSLEEELAGLAGGETPPPVVIRGDRKADYQTMVTIIDSLNRAGIPSFTISTTR